MSRRDFIQQVLDDHFQIECGIAVSTPTPEVWQAISDGLGPQAQFGWSWPLPNNPGVLMPFCPGIIDEQTEHLTDSELDDYLNVIKWVGQTHVLFWFETPDPVERQRRIEDDLYENYPVSLDVWSQVQLAVLDHSCRR